MSTAKLRVHQLTPIIELVEKHLKLGAKPPGCFGPGKLAIEAAAQEAKDIGLSYSRNYLYHRLQKAKEIGLEPDWSLYKPVQYTKPTAILERSPVYVPASTHNRPTGQKITVCVIPDAHDDPRLPDKSRFLWIGRWAAESEPDYLVSIGDFLTLDSLGTHHEAGSLTARGHPSFDEELNSLDNALQTVERGLQGVPCRKLLIKGNHEIRADRFEDRNANLAGTIVSKLDNKFTSLKWRTENHGEFVFLEGVGFIHNAFGASGRPYGGKSGMHRAANDSVFSFVQGHNHLRERVDCPKIGPNHSVTVMSVGCALPYGHVEGYALHSTTGWWWGVVKLGICNGIILDEEWISMLTLEEKYSD